MYTITIMTQEEYDNKVQVPLGSNMLIVVDDKNTGIFDDAAKGITLNILENRENLLTFAKSLEQ